MGSEREELLALVEMHDAVADIEVSEKSADMHRRTAKYLRAYMRGRAQCTQEPTLAQTNSACMSFRHDFGLLRETAQQQERFVALEWLRAWQKEGLAALRAPEAADAEMVPLAHDELLKVISARSPEAADAGAAAWRMRYSDHKGGFTFWTYHESKPDPYRKAEIQPLYTSPANARTADVTSTDGGTTK